MATPEQFLADQILPNDQLHKQQFRWQLRHQLAADPNEKHEYLPLITTPLFSLLLSGEKLPFGARPGHLMRGSQLPLFCWHSTWHYPMACWFTSLSQWYNSIHCHSTTSPRSLISQASLIPTIQR